jgi:hypothetical protein
MYSCMYVKPVYRPMYICMRKIPYCLGAKSQGVYALSMILCLANDKALPLHKYISLILKTFYLGTCCYLACTVLSVGIWRERERSRRSTSYLNESHSLNATPMSY